MSFPRKTSLARLALLSILLARPGAAAPPEAQRWAAAPDFLTAPNATAPEANFLLTQDGAKLTITLDYQGRTITAGIPAVFVLPLGNHARLEDPWVTMRLLKARQSLLSQGWSLWDSRPASVAAVASGTVLSVGTHPVFGPSVEVDLGSGVHTRYFLSRYGKSAVAPGMHVSAGDIIGELGRGLPDDAPFVHLAVLVDAGQGQFISLDPSPFFFTSYTNRALPLADSVLNAAVRAGDSGKVTRLVALGVEPNRKAGDGTCALEWAVMMRDPAMARLLVSLGGDIHAKTADRTGYFMGGDSLTIAHTGPTIEEYAEESEDPDLIAALTTK